jgi:hypothetical protein
MALGASQSGRAVEQSAEELLRVWRLARASARPEVFPGLLDGVMGAFFARCGRLLADGGKPEDVWPGLVGLVRWAPRVGAKELTTEWAIAMEVLTAACESFGSEAAAGGWLARALALAEKGTSTLRDERPDPPRPDGVVVVMVLGEMQAPRRLSRGEDD